MNKEDIVLDKIVEKDELQKNLKDTMHILNLQAKKYLKHCLEESLVNMLKRLEKMKVIIIR